MSKSTNVSHTFCASSYHFRYIYIYLFLTSKKQVKVTECIFAITSFDANVNIFNCPTHFLRQLLPLQIYIFWNCLHPKSRSRSPIANFAITPFDSKYQSVQTLFFTFLIFAKLGPVRTILTDRLTDKHTQKRTSAWL